MNTEEALKAPLDGHVVETSRAPSTQSARNWRPTMTTNEIIHALVAKGFELPEGVEFENGELVEVNWPLLPQTWRKLHILDMIAMTFARQNASEGGRYVLPLALHSMCRGDAEAAIEALWKAVCDADLYETTS